MNRQHITIEQIPSYIIKVHPSPSSNHKYKLITKITKKGVYIRVIRSLALLNKIKYTEPTVLFQTRIQFDLLQKRYAPKQICTYVVRFKHYTFKTEADAQATSGVGGAPPLDAFLVKKGWTRNVGEGQRRQMIQCMEHAPDALGATLIWVLPNGIVWRGGDSDDRMYNLDYILRSKFFFSYACTCIIETI